MSSLRFRYQTIEFGDYDIHVRTLRDRQQFADTDNIALNLGICSASWPLFGVIWESGEVLARVMHDYDVAGRRVLEIGCGVALASLVLNHRRVDVTATDHHPEAGNYLLENTRLNHDRDIPFTRTGWSDVNNGMGRFDIIIGSDLLYNRSHVEPLAAFIEQHAGTQCEIILVDPGRGHHACFSKKMVSMGYSHSQQRPDNTDYLAQPFKGQILRYCR